MSIDYIEILLVFAAILCAFVLLLVTNAIRATGRRISEVARVNSQMFAKEESRCPNAKCQTLLVIAAKFCHICGSATLIQCSECSSTAPLGARFCPQCKHRLWMENGESNAKHA